MSHSSRTPLPNLPSAANPGTPRASSEEGETASSEHWPLRSYLELAALPTAVPCARLHAKNLLHEWRMGHLTGTVELLVSEIVTNAVRASADQAIIVPTVRFWLTSDGNLVLIEVWDSDHRAPSPKSAGLGAESGRGLLLIEALSTRWGSYCLSSEKGKVVWATCAADANRSA